MTVALGIGAVTAVSPPVDAIHLRPLPHPDAERLFGVWQAADVLRADRRGRFHDEEHRRRALRLLS